TAADRSRIPPWQAPPGDPTAQARAAPVGPPRGPFACGTPRGQVHGPCREAHLRVDPTAGQAFRAPTAWDAPPAARQGARFTPGAGRPIFGSAPQQDRPSAPQPLVTPTWAVGRLFALLAW